MSDFIAANSFQIDTPTGTTLDCPLPDTALIHDGDQLVAFCVYADNTTAETLIAPDSWTELDTRANGSSQYSLATTTYQAGVTPNAVFTLTDVDGATTGFNKTVAGVVAYRGADAPISGTIQTGTGATATALGITTTTDDAQVLAIFGQKISSIVAFTNPAGYTERVNLVRTGGGGDALLMCDKQVATASAVSSVAVSTTSASALWWAVLLEIPTAAAASVTTAFKMKNASGVLIDLDVRFL